MVETPPCQGYQDVLPPYYNKHRGLCVRLVASPARSMVLQRAPHPASVWGFAEPGAAVSVSVGSGAAVTGTADKTGKWRISLAPQPASTAATTVTAASTVAGAAKSLVLDDVLFGDVRAV